MKHVRFRTIGCYPLTGAIESRATTLETVIADMLQSRSSERPRRVIDTDAAAAREKKKQEWYSCCVGPELPPNRRVRPAHDPQDRPHRLPEPQRHSLHFSPPPPQPH